MLAGFSFSRIIVVQSLEKCEVATGVVLAEYIAAQLQLAGDDRKIDVLDCESATQFLQLIEQLTVEAAEGSIPLLHVECHGDPDEGLEFSNGSTLKWEILAEALLPLNRATRFNLLSVFSACFGAHFLEQLGVIGPAPCYCLVAPTQEVDPGEIMQGFRAFYSGLFRDADMGAGVRAIANCRLSRGEWLWEPAELWFQRIVTGYVEVHCSKSAARERARKIRKQAMKNGATPGLGTIVRMMKRKNKDELLGQYFNSYFMIEAIPENAGRFSGVISRTSLTLNSLRSTGKYAI